MYRSIQVTTLNTGMENNRLNIRILAVITVILLQTAVFMPSVRGRTIPDSKVRPDVNPGGRGYRVLGPSRLTGHVRGSIMCPTIGKNCTCVPDWRHPGSYTAVYCLGQNIRNLTRLSAISPGVRYLSVERDNLTRLSADSMPTFPNLTSIDLQKCRIFSIDDDVFDHFPYLRRVELSWNRMVQNGSMANLLNLFRAVRKRHITHLFLVKISGGVQFNPTRLIEAFNLLKDSGIQYFAFAYNPISLFPDGMFSALSSLVYLDLRSVTQTTRITEINVKAFRNLTQLNMLQLQLNDLKNFSSWVEDDGKAILPNLTSLYMDFNIFPIIPPELFRGLESLKRLTLDGNCAGLTQVLPYNFSPLKNLRELSLASNRFQQMNETAFDLPKLERLDLTQSTFTFYQMPTTFLQNTPSLRMLKLSGLTAIQHGAAAIRDLLAGLVKLEDLQLRNLELKQLDNDMFANLTNLRHLSMAHNKIRSLPVGIFRHNHKLEELMLGSNKIITINRRTFPTAILDNLTMLEISNNPLVCDCELAWFRMKWMEQAWGRHGRMKDKLNLDYMANDTACDAPQKIHGLNLGNFTINWKECITTELPVLFWVVVLGTTIILLLFAGFATVYKYQWHVKYWCFNLKAKFWAESPSAVDTKAYKFDVFVSYCSADVRWVKTHLLPFERKHRLNFCLHERDWVPGVEIFDNIIESIEESRKIILVISNAFARSQWCHFEMSMIQVKLLEKDRDNVILVVKETVHDYNMTPRLAWHMKSKTYLKWPYADSTDTHSSLGDMESSVRLNTAPAPDLNPSVDSLSIQASVELLVGGGGSQGILSPNRNVKGEELFFKQLERALVKPATSLVHGPVIE